jgi:hypothetical protein
MARVADSTISAFQDFKIRSNVDYLIMRLGSNNEIQVSKSGNDAKTWEEFSRKFHEDEACWGVFNLKYDTKTGGQRNKLVLVQWIPSTCPKKDKMQYAMWTNIIKPSLVGIHCTVQACSVEDLSIDNTLQRATRFERDEL